MTQWVLTDGTGEPVKTYDYDAFGVERSLSSADANPFRYCGEYYDAETGTYYLRARYYDPTLGRFTQEDAHWSTADCIYGDNPRKINERQDALGLTTYSYAPQLLAIMQAGNLCVYCVNDPVSNIDPLGMDAIYMADTSFKTGLLFVGHAVLFSRMKGSKAGAKTPALLFF